MDITIQNDNQPLSDDLTAAVKKESEKFLDYYLWLEKSMPSSFFEEVPKENHLLITHSLMGFDLQNYFSLINFKSAAIVMCLDSVDADLRILRHFEFYGIKSYQSYISKKPAPFSGITTPLRVATIEFMGAKDIEGTLRDKEHLRKLVKEENPSISDAEFNQLLAKMGTPFLHALPVERQVLALHMLYRAKTRDSCQYEVRYEKNWEEKKSASMHIVLAWRNTPKHNFLFRLANVIHRHGLSMKRLNATYTDPHSNQSILIMAISLHGSNGQAVWDVADIPDFLREIITFKYFDTSDEIEKSLVIPRIVSGNMGNLLRAMVNFIHQALVHVDSNLYTVDNIEEDLCRHPELTQQLCEAFRYKLDPNHDNYVKYEEIRQKFLNDITQLDTGQESHDTRRKNVLLQGINFIHHILKTNFYRINYTALSFRMDPNYLNEIPFDRVKKFPELPYAIFYIKGMHFFSFHIRFKDLARGGLRTVYPEQIEQMLAERNQVFTECYHLAWTQQKKNKDIPEGGAKAVIFLKPFALIDSESQILKNELEWSELEPEEIEKKVSAFKQEQKIEFLYQSQRAFIESLLIIINCDDNGHIRARYILDYWKRPEYIYLGPDENMHDFMIEWIANISKKYQYKPGGAFISSKPIEGINHKEYGVTSLGLNVYMHHVLEYLGINPEKDPFTVKMSGGPDGDVAGNQLLNLYRFYPKTAKVIALTDGSGTIHDDNGLDLEIVKDLFYAGKGISYYPPEKLSEGGFLVNKRNTRYPSAYIQETLCWRKKDGKIIEDWISGSDTNHLLRYNVHQAQADVFIPAGGRPRTLNEYNITEYLDEMGNPTSKAIVEGANLYLTPYARRYLEEKGVLIIKDSSANKGGVICSSFEVLCGLAIDEATFATNKVVLVNEILERLKQCSASEAELLLRTHKQSGEYLTAISDHISTRINQYTYQLLDYLDPLPLSNDPNDPMIAGFLNYCLPTLRNNFSKELLANIPDHHKKAIISCHLAAQIVYNRGLDWSPSIVDILPVILSGQQQRA
jgi:glutamate dehydrogenase